MMPSFYNLLVLLLFIMIWRLDMQRILQEPSTYCNVKWSKRVILVILFSTVPGRLILWLSFDKEFDVAVVLNNHIKYELQKIYIIAWLSRQVMLEIQICWRQYIVLWYLNWKFTSNISNILSFDKTKMFQIFIIY